MFRRTVLWGGYEIRRQTEYLIREKFIPVLQAVGSSLDKTVKAQVYLRDIADTPHFLDVWNSHFGARQCALSIIPVKTMDSFPATLRST
jgi:enamine deaminase RidA (YjgF/YER057c/UK114 family)